MSSYLDKTGLERVWSKATNKFATITTAEGLGGRILNLETNSATKQEVSAEVAKLVDSAPETLDTLNELAAALGDDPNFATTISTQIGEKVNTSTYNDGIATLNNRIDGITPASIGAEPTLGFTPVQQGGGEGQGTNTVYIGWATAGDGLKAQVDGVDLGYIMTEHGNGGTLPVHRGGTGATDAATARENLGITPANIGALASTGGTFQGQLKLKNFADNSYSAILKNNSSIVDYGTQISDVSNDGRKVHLMLSAINDQLTFCGVDDVWYSVLTSKNTVTVAQGGTGASDAETALSNLGGFPKTGGTVDGSITTSKGTEWSTFQNVRTVNGEQRDVSMYISGAGDAEFVTGKAGTTVNKMTLGENQTSFMKAVVAPGMIIEQPWGRMSWKVDGVTKAEIIEHFGDATREGGLMFRIYSADSSQYKDLYLDYNDGIKVSAAGKTIIQINNSDNSVNFVGSGASLTSLNAGNITTGTLAITHGGTGATSKSGARTNLGISSGTSLPSSGAAGDIFFLYS